jgi:hypothetical protein
LSFGGRGTDRRAVRPLAASRTEFGDHPEAAVDRMRWIRPLAGDAGPPGRDRGSAAAMRNLIVRAAAPAIAAAVAVPAGTPRGRGKVICAG